MRIASLFTHNKKMPWITLLVVLCCVMITLIAITCPNTYDALSWSNQPEYLWQYVSGAFLHGDNSGAAMAIAHLIANLLMFAPYAIMVEKLIGSKKFGMLFLVTWLGISIVFQIFALLAVPAGKLATGAGLSGSSYAVTAVGAFVLFRVFMTDKKMFFRQPLAYIFVSGLLCELVVLSPKAVGVSSMVIHLAGLLIGIILTVIYKKEICDGIHAIKERQ